MRLAIASLVIATTCGACAATEATTTTTAPAVTDAPRPTPSTLAVQVDAIYPGVLDHADDWARYTCADITDGKDAPTMLHNVALRFSGGGRPDPTPEQVTAIIAVIRPTC